MNFHLSLSQPNRKKSAVRIRFTLPKIKGRHTIQSGVQVVCSTWNNTTSKVTLSKQKLLENGLTIRDAELLNNQLHHAQTTLSRLIHKHQERCFPNAIDPQALKEEFTAHIKGHAIADQGGAVDVISAFDVYTQRPGIKAYHKANLLRTQKKVVEYVQSTGAAVAVEKINHEWLSSFASYWMDNKRTRPQAASTLHSHLKRIRCVLMALDDEYTLARSLNRRIKLIKPTPLIKPTLTISEIAHLASMTFDSATLTRTRDWFVIQCWTGMRRGDLMKLSMNDLSKHDGKWRIRVYQNKTHGLIDIPLHGHAEAIIERLGGLPRPMAHAHYGREIKTICRLAGFNEMMVGEMNTPFKKRGTFPRWKLIASHTARRSAATNLIRTGVSMEVTCLLTGHTNVEQLGAYIQMTPREKSKRLDAAIEQAV